MALGYQDFGYGNSDAYTSPTPKYRQNALVPTDDPNDPGDPYPGGPPPSTTPPPTPAPAPTTGANPNDPKTTWKTAKDYVKYWLSQGGKDPWKLNNPADLENSVNSIYGLGEGKGLKYYKDTNTLSLADPNGYFSQEADGTWKWNDRGPETNQQQGGQNLDSLMQTLLSSFSGNAVERKKLHDTIQGLIDKYSKDPSADDPIIKNQVDAYHGTSERTLQDVQTQMAERAHAEGVGSGAFDSQLNNSRLAQGRAEGSFQSGLIGNELSSRRGALSDIIGKDSALMSDEDKAQLTARISAIDASLRELGLNNQNTQFYDNLARLLAGDASSQDSTLIRTLLGL